MLTMYSIAGEQFILISSFPLLYLTGNINIKTLEESVSSALSVKSKSIDIDSNVNLVISEEGEGENFTVLTGQISPKEKEEEEQTRTITAEAKLGSVKFEKNDWFNSLKLK